jgi:hypothetical protein
VAVNKKGPAEMLLAYNEELPEDCTEGADESDDGGVRRLLRSHAAAANGSQGGFKRAAFQVLEQNQIYHLPGSAS